MKRLYLLRHAKSSWDDPSLDDFDRPLNARGRKAAPRIGRYMAKKDLLPDLVLCSAACRASETWDLVAAALGREVPVRHYRSLYLATPSRLIALARRQKSDLHSLLMVGHNPGTEHLAARLAGLESKRKDLASLNEKYPTGSLAIIDFDIDDWQEMEEGAGRLRGFIRPRDL